MNFENIKITNNSALLIVDMQEDFLPSGSLPVSNGDEIIPAINELAQLFYKNNSPVIFTQDWHPTTHKSFASNHEGKNPGDLIESPGLGPILWPDHCVQGTFGSQIAKAIETKYGIAIIRKGYHPSVDSYSAFFDNDHQTSTGLAGFLQELNIDHVFICGLALDYCCYYTAIDAKQKGFQVSFLSELTRGIDNPKGRISQVVKDMKSKDIRIV